MKRYAVIRASRVFTVTETSDPAFAAANGWIECDNTVNAGDSYSNGVFGPAPAPSAEESRVAGVDEAIASDATVAALKAMSNAEFDAWWSANVTTLAQAGNILKRLARIVIRRVL